MTTPEYFWHPDTQTVSTHVLWEMEEKVPYLLEHKLIDLYSVDTTLIPGSTGRIGRYTVNDNRHAKQPVNWKSCRAEDLPAEFRTALLLLGVQP